VPRQVADQPLGGNPRRDIVSVDAPVAVVPERIGKAIGSFGPGDGAERGAGDISQSYRAGFERIKNLTPHSHLLATNCDLG
jgi:hypothetical protein